MMILFHTTSPLTGRAKTKELGSNGTTPEETADPRKTGGPLFFRYV